MLAGFVTISIVTVVLFVLLLWILRWATTRQLRREAVPGAKVQASAKGVAALALVMGGFWALLNGGALLAVYAGLHPMLLSVGVVVLLSVARPLLAPRIHPFVIRQSGPAMSGNGMRRDDSAVYAEHRAAIARGEQRALRWTVSGAPHSYAKDEHVSPTDDPYNIRSLGLGIPLAAGYLGASALFGVFFANQIVRGEPLNWLFLVGVFAFLITGWPAFRFCRDEFRASRVRKARGVPRPDRAQEIQLPDNDQALPFIDLSKRPEESL